MESLQFGQKSLCVPGAEEGMVSEKTGVSEGRAGWMSHSTCL